MCWAFPHPGAEQSAVRLVSKDDLFMDLGGVGVLEGRDS